MGKRFNTTGVCIPDQHYMVNIEEKLKQIKLLIQLEEERSQTRVGRGSSDVDFKSASVMLEVRSQEVGIKDEGI